MLVSVDGVVSQYPLLRNGSLYGALRSGFCLMLAGWPYTGTSRAIDSVGQRAGRGHRSSDGLNERDEEEDGRESFGEPGLELQLAPAGSEAEVPKWVERER